MRFTVFTPTYNRAHTLHRVYESLLEQTFTDFEWLVIDDGSTDNTHQVIEHLVNCANFPIRYDRLERNRGKHIAHNRALELANGEFLLVADSDDWIVPNALERMDHHWSRLPDTRDYCGVAGLCADRNGEVIGDPYPLEATHSTLRERRYIHKVKGEKWGSMLTAICKRYPFPEHIDGFVPEGVVWHDIAKTYKDYCVNEVFRIYDNASQSH